LVKLVSINPDQLNYHRSNYYQLTKIMKTLFKVKALSLLFCAVLVSSIVSAQDSPRQNASGTVAGASVNIDYGSPSVRGRKIWGDLVPFGQLWRTGANPATIFQTNKDIKIEGKVLPAGKYSIFTLPGENEWTVIFNSETGQWGIRGDGTANDDPEKDVLTVTVKPEKSKDFNEHLTFAVDDKGFTLLWENLAVPVKVE
jgi:hypothetical protein